MLAESLAAWIALPIVAVAIAAGLSLLLERAVGERLGVLRVPVGLCAAVCITLASYWVGLPGEVAAALIVVPAVAGLVLERAELRLWRPGWFTLGFLAAYGLHLAPVVLTGEWTWAGYNFVNDTAAQMVLAEWLPDHGMDVAALRESTTTEFVRSYFATKYPLGSHALYATLTEIVPGPLASFYQPFIALLAAATGTALAQMAHRLGLPAVLAAAAGVLAVGANLFYQYALQGNLKEIAFLMAFAAAAATGRELITSERPLRAAVAPAICFAAAFEIYSVASGAYLVALGLGLAIAAFLCSERASIPRLAKAGVALTAGALALAAPGLAGAVTFKDVASQTFSSVERSADLGHLVRPLELIQMGGIWLTGDYRLPVPEGREILTVVLIVVAGLLLVAGLVWAFMRREPGPIVVIVATAAAAAWLLPKLSPYASGKVLALASPIVVFGAALGAWALTRRFWPLGAVLGLALAVGVMWSNAFAYHVVRLAPTERMKALDDAGRHVKDIRDPVLVNEPEEFAKVFDGGANYNVSTEAITVTHIGLRAPQGFAARYFDLDDQLLDFVESYPAIIKRRAPDASRPPANYRLTYSNDWYEVWRRRSGPEVLEHLPLQTLHRRALEPGCADVLALAERAGSGEQLVAAEAPAAVTLETANASRALYWIHSYQPGTVIPQTPGRATAVVNVREPGRYRAWVQGSFTRPIEARVDSTAIGSASGVNNLGQWLPAGETEVTPGRHRLRLIRPGGDLSPGDGYQGELGPLTLERIEEPSFTRVAPDEARELCGKPWDWIERVRP